MQVKDSMGKVKVKDIMNKELISLNPSMSIIDALKNQFFQIDYSTLPITSEKKLLGLITISNIKRIPRSRWNTTNISKVMNKVSKNNSLSLEDKATVALTKMIRTQLDLLPVVDDNRLVGFVTQDILLGLLGAHERG